MAHQWTEESDVLSIFPTLVWRFELTTAAREAVNAQILDAFAKLRRTDAGSDPLMAWQSGQELYTLASFRDLVSYIQDNTVSIFRFIKIGHDGFEITACWATINPTGVAHSVHSHPNNFLSGVYYVQTQTGADTVYFHDPRIQAGIIRPPVAVSQV
ncbi:MAG: TIGR02466 family protein [Pseudomonadales bacterium]